MENRFIYLMDRRMSHKNGFTMIEMLFCLSMLSLMMLLGISKQNVSLKEDQVLENMIERAQIYAMTHKEQVYLEFQQQSLKIYTLKEDIETYQLQSNHIFLTPQTLYFNEKGHINHGATIEVQSNHQCYKIVFHLGMGRYYIEM